MTANDRPVLVTGANGMVGSRLVQHLLERGHAVRAMTRQPLDGTAPRLANVLADLHDPASLEAAVRGVSVVYHCAADVGTPATTPEKFERTNHLGTRALAREAEAAGCSRFVNVSTVAVYGGGVQRSMTELRGIGPITSYARSKYAAERAVVEAAQSMEWVILRPTAVYGPNERTYLPMFAGWILAGGAPLVEGHGGTLDFLHEDDLARALFLAGETSDAAGQIYNVGGGAPRGLVDIYGLLAECMGRELVCAEAKDVPGMTWELGTLLAQDKYLSIEKAREQLGYNPEVTLEFGLEQFVTAQVNAMNHSTSESGS